MMPMVSNYFIHTATGELSLLTHQAEGGEGGVFVRCVAREGEGEERVEEGRGVQGAGVWV